MAQVPLVEDDHMVKTFLPERANQPFRTDILFIEATFLEADAALAKARHHLTARQAGTIARLSRAKQIVTLHYSPRYKDKGHRLAEETQNAFVRG
jgi:ribonuclease Z